MKTGSGSATHPSLAVLHNLFDGVAVDAASARHARECPTCSHRLQALSDQRQALGHLGRRRSHWVSATQQRARLVLADLVAELARGCLARRDATPRTTPLSELPRPAERVTADIRTLATRMTRLAALPEAAGAAIATATATATAMAMATDWTEVGRIADGSETDPARLDRCVAVLRALEGNSARVRALS